MDKEYFKQNVISELERKGISSDDMPINLIADIAGDFFGMVEVSGIVYYGIGGFLQHIYGCLLQAWIEEAKKHEGVKCSDVPELVAKLNEIDSFKKYTKKYLGFEEINGSFKEVKEKQSDEHENYSRR